MKIKLLCFALVRELAGRESMEYEVPAGTTAGGLLDRLCETHPALGEYRPVLKVSVDEELVEEGFPLRQGNTVAVFPPVGGG